MTDDDEKGAESSNKRPKNWHDPVNLVVCCPSVDEQADEDGRGKPHHHYQSILGLRLGDLVRLHAGLQDAEHE